MFEINECEIIIIYSEPWPYMVECVRCTERLRPYFKSSYYYYH